MRDSPIVIVGGDSKIGGALAAQLHGAGERVLCTSRRRDAAEPAAFLDLADADTWQPPDNVRAAVLCAALARIETCRTDPQGTRRINVDGLLTAARKLRDRGAFLVFLSTNAVFDGSKPHRGSAEPTCPMTEYGRQKADAERLLRELDGNTAIVRFAKILEPKVPLFAQWKRNLTAGQLIEPFTDMGMAPAPLACAVSALRLILDRREGGVFHVSGERDISYAQIGLWLAEVVGADPGLVRPVSARGCVQEHIPRHTTLAVDRLLDEFGVQPPPVAWSIRQALISAK